MAKAKEQITIEALLDWAYRVQCVDRRAGRAVVRGAPKGLPGASATAQFEMLGTRVDTSGVVVVDPTAIKTDDALLVHDAVLAVPEMWLEWIDETVVVWTRDRAKVLGRVIENVGGDWMLFEARGPAGSDLDPVRLEQVGVAVLLVIHAKSGSVPDWHEGHCFRPGVKPADGSGMRSRNRVRAPVGGFSDHEVIHARALYVAWHMALRHLAAGLVLDRFTVLPPESPEAPWFARPRNVLKRAEMPDYMQRLSS